MFGIEKRERQEVKSDNVQPKLQVEVIQDKNEEYYLDMLSSYFVLSENSSFIKMNRKEISKEEFLNEVREYLDLVAQGKTDEFKKSVVEQFEKDLWGFSVLEDLINDSPSDEETISDIKIVTYDNIRIKKNGERMSGNVSFSSNKSYVRFVNSIATKNSKNLSVMNAETTFTDNISHPEWTLRFTIATNFISATGSPVVHVRKLPKKHKSLSYYQQRGKLVTQEQMDYLRERILDGSGFLIVGKTGAGKTIFFNGLLDYVPHNKAIMVIQEYQELNNLRDDDGFVPHPEMVFFNTVEANGEGKIEYDLNDVAKIGLRFDVDYFAISEVKGGEARYLLNCIKTGSVGMCSCHGSSVEDGMDKLADYITYDSRYTKSEALAELRRLNTVVFIDGFRVKDIAEVTGYDWETGQMKYRHVSFS